MKLKNTISRNGMEKETDTICGLIKNNTKCRGSILRDERMSRLENSLEHRKYTCDKCNTSYKFNI
jgi:hypothetical protein